VLESFPPQSRATNLVRHLSVLSIWLIQGDIENLTISVDLEEFGHLAWIASRFRVQADQNIGRNHPLTFGQEHQWVDIELDDG